MKKLLLCIALGLSTLGVFLFVTKSVLVTTVTDSIVRSALVENIVSIKKVFTPGPLRVTATVPLGDLDATGVIEKTNSERIAAGRKPLKENKMLDQTARQKLEDMAQKQYFEHISPTGVGPSDLAQDVGYGYIVIGENLALGDFKNNADLLRAWMNSSGHRENILLPRFTEIGVAVGKRNYEGHVTWLAVQEFGKPEKDCPQTDPLQKVTVESQKKTVTDEEQELSLRHEQLQNTPHNTGAETDVYNERVQEYNTFAEKYRADAGILKKLIDAYNATVELYNTCIAAE